MNNVIKIKIVKASHLTWVSFECVCSEGIGDRIETLPLDDNARNILALELIAAASELIALK